MEKKIDVKKNIENILADQEKIELIESIIDKHNKIAELYKETEQFFKKYEITTLLNEYRYALRSFVDIFAFGDDFDKYNDPYIRSIQSLNHIYCDLIDVIVIFARDEFEQLARKYGYTIIEEFFEKEELKEFLSFLEKFEGLIGDSRKKRKDRTKIYMEKIGEDGFIKFYQLYQELFSYENLYKLEKIQKEEKKKYYSIYIFPIIIASAFTGILGFIIAKLF